MIPWKEVENNPQYQTLSLAEQQKAKEQYFNEVVAPKVPQVDLELARTQFFTEPLAVSPAPMPKITKREPVSLKQIIGKGSEILAETLAATEKEVKAIPEIALTLATGIPAWVGSEIAGLAKLATSGAEEARKTRTQVAEYFTWKPYGKKARERVQLIGKGFEKVMWPAKKIGEIVEKATGSKELGYVTALGGELAILKGLHVAGGKTKAKVKGKLRKPMPGEPGYTTPKGRAEAMRKAELGERLKEAKPERPLAELRKAERKVRLVEEAKKGFITEPTIVKRRPGPEYYPKGAEYIAGKPSKAIVEYKPIITRKGKPFKNKQQANFTLKQKGLSTVTHEIIPHKTGFAIRRKSEITLRDRYVGGPITKGAETLYERDIKKMTPQEREVTISELETKGVPTTVGALNLKRGDVIKSGFKGYIDTYKVHGKDKAGNFVLKDGETIKVDEFDRLPIIGEIKRGTKKTVKEIKQARIEKLPLGARIVDEVKQPVDVALLAQKKGKPEVVTKMAEKARKNAELLRLADGPTVERLINKELERLPKEEQPSPSTQTLDFLGLQSAYEKALATIRGIRKPKLVTRPTLKDKVTLIEKPKEFKELKPGESLRSHVEALDEPLAGKGLKEKAIRVKEGIAEEALSPETVYRRDPAIGSKIYKIMDKADIEKNKFLANEGEKFVKATGKIKQDSVSSSRVGAVLDGKISRSELKSQEAHLYDFLKDRFDFLLRYYARSRAGSEVAYKQVVTWVNQPYKPVARIKSLSEYKRSRYNTMRKRLAEVRGGKKVSELKGAKARQYRQIQRNMREMLHKEWLEKLPEGQREAYTALSRRIKDYLPHIFDKEHLLAEFKSDVALINKKLKTATNPGSITRYKKRLRELQDAIVGLEKGKLVTYESLPKNVRFKFFETRKGAKGYSFDAVKAYNAYLTGIARKIYDEPAIRMAAELHKSLDPSLKAYNKWFIRNYMGWDRSKLDALSGAIASAQWMRTLGFNPRSAIVNFTQRLNTITEVGVKHSITGERLGFTKKGNQLFDQTGIAREIPTVLMEGTVPEGMERMRAIAGFLFNKVELGNRKHAFLSGYTKAKTRGMNEKAAIQYGIDIVHKTQFRYGKIGMPRMLRRPVGRLVGQFMSYPIKQIELLANWIRNEPAKAIKFIAYAEGVNYTLKEFLDTDLSNALGFGITWSEVMNAMKDMSEADWRGFWRHLRLSVSGGGGLLPSGLGPTATGAIEVARAVTKGRGFEQLKKEFTPVQLKRFVDAYKSVIGERKELYPVYDRKGHVMYYLTAPQLVRRTIGPRPAKESREWIEWQKETLLEQERREILQDIKEALIKKDTERARSLIKKYKIYPTFDSIVEEKLKRKLSREEMKKLKPMKKKEEYQLLREGKVFR